MQKNNQSKTFRKQALRLTMAAGLSAMMLAVGQAQANDERKQYNVSAQAISTAIIQFANQSKLRIAASGVDISDYQTQGVTGKLTQREALASLLEGTKLAYEYTGDNTVVIKMAEDTGGQAGKSGEREVSADKFELIEEIIVTAQKRETRLQDTALAISVLGADTIDKRGLVSMGDYLSTIPGVTMQDRGAGANSFVIRGIAVSPQTERDATGIYFGEIPVSGMRQGGSAGSTDIRMVDIERVEVLKGPQGTLYGADAMGGVVRIIPAAPNLEQMEGKVVVGYSQTGERGGDNTRVEGVFNVPLIKDTLALRGVAYRIDNSGSIDSIAPTGDYGYYLDNLSTYGGTLRIKDGIGGDETSGARLSARWQPVERLDITLSHTWQKIEQEGLREVELNLPGAYEQVRALIVPSFPPRGSGNYPQPEGITDETHLTSLVANYDLGWGSLHSASSWVDREGSYFYDYSFLYPAFLGNVADYQENDVFSQEIRFSSKFDGPVQVVLGGYYEDRESPRVYAEGFSGDPAHEADSVSDSGWVDCCLLPAAPSAEVFEALSEDYYFIGDYSAMIEQKSVFGEISYDITDRLTATLGVRHFEYDQESYALRTGWWAWSLTPVKSTPLKTDYSDENYKANLSWKPNDNTLFYAQWAEGFRLGKAQAPKKDSCDADNNGAYELADGGEISQGNIDPDYTENFELGYKATFADNRISLNAAIYRINWEGLPVGLLLAGTGCGRYSVNAGKSIAEGVELESSVYLMDDLRLDLGASYNEAKLDGDAPNIGSDGDDLPGSADINFSAGLEYAFRLSGYDAFARVDYAYVGEYDTYVNQPSHLPSSGDYTQVHLKAGATFGNASVDLFVKNLTNADDLTWVESGFGKRNSPRAFRLRPRTMGVSFSYRF